jgi:hypothetical protein
VGRALGRKPNIYQKGDVLIRTDKEKGQTNRFIVVSYVSKTDTLILMSDRFGVKIGPYSSADVEAMGYKKL